MRMGLYNKPNEVRSYKVRNKMRAKIRESCVSGKVNKLKENCDCTANILSQLFLHKRSRKAFCSAPKLSSSHYRCILGSASSAQGL